MFEEVKKQINLGLRGKILAFLILLGISYTFVWAIIEPLNLEWINNKNSWRIFLIAASIVAKIDIYIVLFPKKTLQKFGFNPYDSKLTDNFSSHGSPTISKIFDGYHGEVYQIDGNYSQDELDWELKNSAHTASFITYTYLPENKLMLYLRVNLLSKTNRIQKLKWIRLDPIISIVDGDPN